MGEYWDGDGNEEAEPEEEPEEDDRSEYCGMVYDGEGFIIGWCVVMLEDGDHPHEGKHEIALSM